MSIFKLLLAHVHKMASRSQFYGRTNSFIASRGTASADINARVTSLKQRIDFLNTNFQEFKATIFDTIKNEVEQSKEEILEQMRLLIEGVTKEKAKKSYRRKVPKELAVSRNSHLYWSGQKGLEQRKCVV